LVLGGRWRRSTYWHRLLISTLGPKPMIEETLWVVTLQLARMRGRKNTRAEVTRERAAASRRQ
jgi:hypothetical protein